jgi:sigma-E factor negative regulatory protein RseA
MPIQSDSQLSANERLSALLDGELVEPHVRHACADWRHQVESQTTWHAYHLIGDALRSDDLAADPMRDMAFMQSLRARLAQEPVALASRRSLHTAERKPEQQVLIQVANGASHVVNGTHDTKSSAWSWVAPSAVAVGFVALVGSVMLTPRSPEITSTLASSPAAPVAIAQSTSASEPQPLLANSPLIRNVRLDRYLDAHQQFAGSSALGVPSAYMRSATTVNRVDR